MPSNLLQPVVTRLVTVAAAAVTATSAKFTVPLADCYSFCLNVSAVTGTSPTLDVVFQTSIDGGTTFVDLPWKLTQVTTTASPTWLLIQPGMGRGEAATQAVGADTGAGVSKNMVFDNTNMKIKYTIAGTNPTYTFTLTVFSQPRTSFGY